MKKGDLIQYRHLNGILYTGQVTYTNKDYTATRVINGANVGSLQFLMNDNERLKIEVVR